MPHTDRLKRKNQSKLIMRIRLFGPNNHSQYKIIYRPLDKQNQLKIADLVLNHYSVKEVKKNSIKQVCEKEAASNNFQIKTLRLDGSVRTMLLRKNILITSKSSTDLLEKTILFLKNKGVIAPEFIKTKKGNTHFRKNGYIWQAYKFIEGNHYRGSRKELISVAKGIALLHKIFKKYPYIKNLKKRSKILPPWKIKELIGILEMASRRRKTDIDNIFLKNSSYLEKIGKRTHEQFGKIKKSRCQVIHGDLHPHNTIFENERLKALLDFEFIQESELLRDIGFAAHRFARQYAVYHKGSVKKANEGFNLFLKNYTKINKLSDKELQQLPIFIKDEILRRIVKDFYPLYFKGWILYASREELIKKINLLKEAETFSCNY